MAEKHEIRKRISRIQSVKIWQLIVLLLMTGFVMLTFLRLNHIGMDQRREAVLLADKEGETAVIEQRLYDLQRYVSQHMFTDTSRVPLEHSYKRAYDEALSEFENNIANASSNDVLSKVLAYCDSLGTQGGWGRFSVTADPRYVSCIDEQWSNYPAAVETNYEFKAPPTEPYYHTFSAPVWSPDFAGWSVVIFGLILLLIIYRILALFVLKLLLKYRYRQA